jgi:hypothetical protein
MRSSVEIKPMTDVYGALATSSILAVPLAQVQVLNPAADADPNVAGLLPTNARVLVYPTYGQRTVGNVAFAILGPAASQLTTRMWWYNTPSGKWLSVSTSVALVPAGATSAASFFNTPRSAYVYLQTTAVIGAVTELTYGFYN